MRLETHVTALEEIETTRRQRSTFNFPFLFLSSLSLLRRENSRHDLLDHLGIRHPSDSSLLPDVGYQNVTREMGKSAKWNR